MYFGAVQICGERVGTAETKDFCEALDAHKIKMLSLRECGISTKNFKKITDSLAYCQSILHLNFNLCGIHCDDRVEMLAAALNMNRSLTALLLHGNHFGSDGICKLVRPLILHPQLSCLDVGDCDIGDKGLKNICELLPPEGDKPGLQELVLSGNPRITSRAWEKFSVAVSACSTLRSLYIDFNGIGETAGKMLVVCAAGHKSLNVLDMEACDLSESVGRLLLHLLQRYPTTLSHVLLEENDICEETKYAIRIALGESESEESSSDDGACDMKQKDCKPRQRKSRKAAVPCASSEEEIICKKKPRKRHHQSKSCPEMESSNRSKCSVVRMKRTPRQHKSKDPCKPLRCEPPSDTSELCASTKPSKLHTYKEASDLEETLAKFKICVREVSESSEEAKEKEVSDPACEYKTDEISPSTDCEAGDQVCCEGVESIQLQGDCKGSTVKLKLRSKSKECDAPGDVLVCERKPRSDSRKTRKKNVGRQTEYHPLTKEQCCQLHIKSRSRSRGFYGSKRTLKHRGSFGLAHADMWSDEECEPAREKKEKCGRGPWCGRGPLRYPNRPMERMSTSEDTYDHDGYDSYHRHSTTHRSSETPHQYSGEIDSETQRASLTPQSAQRMRPSGVPRRLTGALKTGQRQGTEFTDLDVSDLGPDSSAKRMSTLYKIETVNKRSSEPMPERGLTSQEPKRASFPKSGPQKVSVNPKETNITFDIEAGGESVDPTTEDKSALSEHKRTVRVEESIQPEESQSKSQRVAHNTTLNNSTERSTSRSGRSNSRDRKQPRSGDASARRRNAPHQTDSKNPGFLSSIKKFFVGEDVVQSQCGDRTMRGNDMARQRKRRQSLTRGCRDEIDMEISTNSFPIDIHVKPTTSSTCIDLYIRPNSTTNFHTNNADCSPTQHCSSSPVDTAPYICGISPLCSDISQWDTSASRMQDIPDFSVSAPHLQLNGKAFETNNLSECKKCDSLSIVHSTSNPPNLKSFHEHSSPLFKPLPSCSESNEPFGRFSEAVTELEEQNLTEKPIECKRDLSECVPDATVSGTKMADSEEVSQQHSDVSKSVKTSRSSNKSTVSLTGSKTSAKGLVGHPASNEKEQDVLSKSSEGLVTVKDIVTQPDKHALPFELSDAFAKPADHIGGHTETSQSFTDLSDIGLDQPTQSENLEKSTKYLKSSEESSQRTARLTQSTKNIEEIEKLSVVDSIKAKSEGQLSRLPKPSADDADSMALSGSDCELAQISNSQIVESLSRVNVPDEKPVTSPSAQKPQASGTKESPNKRKLSDSQLLSSSGHSQGEPLQN